MHAQATLLARVDGRRYSHPAQYTSDAALIPAGERQFWGDDPAGVRPISRACALEDEIRAALPGNSCRCTGYQGMVDAALETLR